MKAAGCVLLLFLTLSSSLFAQHPTILRVPQSYKSIQSAINAARAGDTVLVDHGIYYENLRIKKNIVLASRFIVDGDSTHRAKTIVDGSRCLDRDKGSTISIYGETDTTMVLMGLTVRGGTGTRIKYEHRAEPALAGGGIYIRATGCHVLSNIIIENNVDTDRLFGLGGGIHAMPPEWNSEGERIVIEKNVVERNSVRGTYVNGGGISMYASGLITGNTVIGNVATPTKYWGVGGGICAASDYMDSIFIEKNRIIDNECRRAGGIGCSGAGGNSITVYVMIKNNIVKGNRGVERGGGIAIWERAEGYLVNNTVIRNTAGIRGSGIDIGNAPGYLINNVIHDNSPAPQLFVTSMIQAYHNVVQEELFGDHNSTDVPEFINDETAVQPKSPLLGAGIASQYIHGIRISAPLDDIDGRKRPSTPGESIDIGAVEYDRLTARASSGEHQTKLTVRISADTSSLAGAAGFSLAQRSTKVEFLVQDTVLLDHHSPDVSLDLPSHNAPLLVELTHMRNRGEPTIYVSYALEGRDHFDQYANTNTFAGYSRWSPGEYVLKVRSEHSEYVRVGWADDRIRIRVPEPWWERWWFQSLVLTGLLVLFAFIYRREIHRARKDRAIQQEFSRRQIESQESERKRIAAELHDGLGQNLLLANNELQQYLQQSDGNSEGVRQAASLLQESIHSVREMASNLHPHQIERLGFCAAVKSLVEMISHAAGFVIKVRCDDVDRLLPKDTEVQLYRIIQEALSNVVQHASAREASVEIWNNPGGVELVVSDDGRGFNADEIARIEQHQPSEETLRGFGISSMTERARIIGGELKIESSEGHGTTISVLVPIHENV